MIFILWCALSLSPPGPAHAYDAPDDGGGVIIIEWQLSPDDTILDGYEIYRSQNGIDFEKVGFIGRNCNSIEDQTEDKIQYYYKVAFGYTVMARVSLLIGRIQFLLGPWLGIVK